ncbi:MAG: thiamine pyrophosphate-binding protein, partial [Rhodoplanes sp.]
MAVNSGRIVHRGNQHEECSMALGTDFILNALAREGLSHLFLVPGGLIDPFLPALARHPELKPIVAAHEG